ncbi:MAG: Lrp/AsnC ligand binding domain-containing protein, partial [Candidatus Lokiarchaeota archaeon]|nr:Lrp/AsnC ligand binding domain-containing protein [Candidatus Lokiarchaeota archaeon]
DKKDYDIICLLGEDARITLSEMSKRLSLSHVAIRNRLIKLLNKEYVRTSVLVNILKLNLEVVHLLIQTEGAESTRNLIERFQNCPRVIQMCTVLGQFDLMTTVFEESKRRLEIILRTCIFRTKGIRNVSVLSVGQLISPPFFPIEFQRNTEDTAPCGFDCLECNEYKLNQCPGCPATSSYKGVLNFCLEKNK